MPHATASSVMGRLVLLAAVVTAPIVTLAQDERTLVVKPSAAASGAEIEALQKSLDAEAIKTMERSNARIWRLPESRAVDEVVERLRRDGRVSYAAPTIRDVPVLLSGRALPTDLSATQRQTLQALIGTLAQQDYRITRSPVDLTHDVLDVGFDQRQMMGVELLDGHVIELKRHDAGATGPVWRGAPVDAEGSATLVHGTNGITGTIEVGDAVYSVFPLGDGQQAIMRVRDMPPDHPPSYEQLESPSPAHDVAPHTADAGDDGCAPEESGRIDVLVAYTTRVAQVVPDVDALLMLAIAETNRSYDNSGIDLEARLAGSMEVDYTERGFEQDLAALRSTDDGVMDEVHAKRDALEADVVVLLTDRSEFCGLASAIPATTADQAFAVVYWRCATGYYSFAHEIGHLQGARHDAAVDPTNAPYPHGHGHVSSPNWRTVMAYANACGSSCARIDHWSNPNVQYLAAPTGEAGKSENYRVLAETAPVVGRFRCAPPNP